MRVHTLSWQLKETEDSIAGRQQQPLRGQQESSHCLTDLSENRRIIGGKRSRTKRGRKKPTRSEEIVSVAWEEESSSVLLVF